MASKASARLRASATAGSPGSAVMSSKIAQKSALTSAWSGFETSGMRLQGSVDHTALSQTIGQDLLDGADEPWGAVGDHQQRGAQPASEQAAQERHDGVVGLR